MHKLYESKSYLCDVDVGLVWLDGHPMIYVKPFEGGGVDAMLRVMEGKLSHITHDIPTIRMERIHIDTKEHVLGVPPSWLLLIRKVSRTILCYQEVVAEATEVA